MRRFLICIQIVFAAVLCSAAERCTIRVNDFVNNSEYKGNWKIGAGLSAILREKLPREHYEILASTPEYVLDGSVDNFTLGSRGLASYGIGGYQDYSAKVIINLTLRKRGGPVVKNFSVIGRRIQQNTGLSLLGGPVGDDRYKAELERLWNLQFDSIEFRGTVLGKSIEEVMYQAMPRISGLIFGQPYGLRGEIVKVSGKDVYIDAGSDNGVKAGQYFNVYSPSSKLYHPKTGKFLGDVSAKHIGKLMIKEVRGPNLSVAHIIEAAEDGEKNENMVSFKEDDYVVLE
ncbi:MAG: hypothetical protein ABII64_02665 [Elusimicrobiota bacterium]